MRRGRRQGHLTVAETGERAGVRSGSARLWRNTRGPNLAGQLACQNLPPRCRLAAYSSYVKGQLPREQEPGCELCRSNRLMLEGTWEVGSSAARS